MGRAAPGAEGPGVRAHPRALLPRLGTVRRRGVATDPRERFEGLADRYARFRPAYPPELFDWLARLGRLAPGARVADLGCGTGISARALAGRGWRVVGVDPSEDMLREARRAGPEVAYRSGDAAATGLPSGAFDLVSAGQAFHWFDLAPAMAEIHRLLRPGGIGAAFWNVRADVPALREYERILRAYCPDYGARPQPAQTLPEIVSFPGLAILGRQELPHATELDLEGLLGRAYSSSYVALSLSRKADFDRELRALFERHARGGRLEFPYVCRAVAWRFA